MPTVAEQLRQAREAKKLTVHQVADITKIRTDHIRALEEGRYEVFSAPVYIRGFVRTLAGVLKLDVKQIMAALDAELGRTDKFSEPPPLSNEPRGVLDFLMLQLSKVDWRRSLIGLGAVAGLALIALIAVVVRHYQSKDPLASMKPGYYQSTNRNSGETLAVPQPASHR
jgi:cytoskeletal protein RodZ